VNFSIHYIMWVDLYKATTPGYLRYNKFIIYKIQELNYY